MQRRKEAKGRYNLEADCLSRNPVLEPNENQEEQLKVNLIKLKDIKEDQEKNEYLQSRKEKKLKSDHNKYYKKSRKKTI